MSLKGFAFGKMFLIFLIGSILGAYYEELLNIATQIINHQKVVYEYRRGIIYGPFSPIYGMGTVIMTLVLCKKERTLRKTFLLAAIVGGITEYLISFLQETFIGTISWDYSDKLLNINGRTTIPYMAFWGLLGVIFVKYIYPPLSSFIENIPDTIGQCLVTLLFVLFIIDFTLSMCALFRQHYRNQNIPPKTVIGRLCDKYYTDDFLYKYYPNMIRTNK